MELHILSFRKKYYHWFFDVLNIRTSEYAMARSLFGIGRVAGDWHINILFIGFSIYTR